MKPSVAWLILRNGKKLIGFCICWGNFYLPPIYSRGIFEICCKMLTSHPINSCRSAIAVSRLPSISFPSNKYFIKLPTRSLFFLGDYYPLLLPSSCSSITEVALKYFVISQEPIKFFQLFVQKGISGLSTNMTEITTRLTIVLNSQYNNWRLTICWRGKNPHPAAVRQETVNECEKWHTIGQQREAWFHSFPSLLKRKTRNTEKSSSLDSSRVWHLHIGPEWNNNEASLSRIATTRQEQRSAYRLQWNQPPLQLCCGLHHAGPMQARTKRIPDSSEQ